MSDLMDLLETLEGKRRSRNVDRTPKPMTPLGQFGRSPSVRSVTFAQSVEVKALDQQLDGIEGVRALDVKRALVGRAL